MVPLSTIAYVPLSGQAEQGIPSLGSDDATLALEGPAPLALEAPLSEQSLVTTKAREYGSLELAEVEDEGVTPMSPREAEHQQLLAKLERTRNRRQRREEEKLKVTCVASPEWINWNALWRFVLRVWGY